MELVAPQHVESSWTRDRTCVPCIGRQILIHCTTREVWTAALIWVFSLPAYPSACQPTLLDLPSLHNNRSQFLKVYLSPSVYTLFALFLWRILKICMINPRNVTYINKRRENRIWWVTKEEMQMINKFKNVMTWNKSQAQEAQKISSMIIMPKMQQLGITYSVCTKSKVRKTWEKPEEKMHYLQKIKD